MARLDMFVIPCVSNVHLFPCPHRLRFPNSRKKGCYLIIRTYRTNLFTEITNGRPQSRNRNMRSIKKMMVLFPGQKCVLLCKKYGTDDMILRTRKSKIIKQIIYHNYINNSLVPMAPFSLVSSLNPCNLHYLV